MERRIVSDSSINHMRLPFYGNYATVPMKILAGGRTYVDDEYCDVRQMVKDLSVFKGRTSTACPSPDEWTEAFGDADEVFCLTISSNLSGSFNAAQVAAREYMENHPGRRVLLMDSLSTGAEMYLMAERLAQLFEQNKTFDEIVAAMEDHQKHHNLIFCLQSVRSLANNGRLNPAIAALIGMLGVRLVGCASEKGELEMMAKCRGDKKALTGIQEALAKLGYVGGRMHIEHCNNVGFAETIKAQVMKLFPSAAITMGETTALCSYYAEEGGILIGFATA